MNSKTTKIISVLLLLSLIIVGALGFYISMKIDPKALKAETISYVEKKYPNLKLEIGDLSVGLGLTSEVLLTDITLANIGKVLPSKLFSLKEAKVKIPLLNMLTGGGTIKIYFDKPEVGFHHFYSREPSLVPGDILQNMVRRFLLFWF